MKDEDCRIDNDIGKWEKAESEMRIDSVYAAICLHGDNHIYPATIIRSDVVMQSCFYVTMYEI